MKQIKNLFTTLIKTLLVISSLSTALSLIIMFVLWVAKNLSNGIEPLYETSLLWFIVSLGTLYITLYVDNKTAK